MPRHDQRPGDRDTDRSAIGPAARGGPVLAERTPVTRSLSQAPPSRSGSQIPCIHQGDLAVAIVGLGSTSRPCCGHTGALDRQPTSGFTVRVVGKEDNGRDVRGRCRLRATDQLCLPADASSQARSAGERGGWDAVLRRQRPARLSASAAPEGALDQVSPGKHGSTASRHLLSAGVDSSGWRSPVPQWPVIRRCCEPTRQPRQRRERCRDLQAVQGSAPRGAPSS